MPTEPHDADDLDGVNVGLVIVGDILLHPGIDWSETLIVRMIYERRSIGK